LETSRQIRDPLNYGAPCSEAAAAADAGFMHAKRPLDWPIGVSSQVAFAAAAVSLLAVVLLQCSIGDCLVCQDVPAEGRPGHRSPPSSDGCSEQQYGGLAQRLVPRYHWPLRIDRHYRAIKATSLGAAGPSRIRTQPAAKSRHVKNSLTIIHSRLTIPGASRSSQYRRVKKP
jgi:hypothetical protein